MKKFISQICFFLILLSLVFSITGCSESSKNNNSNSGSSQIDTPSGDTGGACQGGTTGDNNQPGGSADIINASIRAMYDEDDNLRYTPATAGTGEDLSYQWNFDDGKDGLGPNVYNPTLITDE